MGWEPVGHVHVLSDEAARQHLTDWLFLETLADLRARSAGPLDHSARYRVLGIAPLLRKMLADGRKTLLARVCDPDGRRMPLFRASGHDISSGAGSSSAGFGIGLGVHTYGPELPLDAFLGLRAGVVRDQELSVKEVIRHYAHVEGGVHLGLPEDEASELLQLTLVDPPPGLPLWVMSLASIAQIVILGCAELESIVRTDFERRRAAPRPDELQDLNVRFGFSSPASEQVSP